MKFSRILAVILGIFVPVAETIRRWDTWHEAPLRLFDDYMLAGLILYSAWLTGQDLRRGQSFLAAGWGMAVGVAYGSFFRQLDHFRAGEPDPAPIPAIWVVVVKGALLVLSIIALVVTLRARPGTVEISSGRRKG